MSTSLASSRSPQSAPTTPAQERAVRAAIHQARQLLNANKGAQAIQSLHQALARLADVRLTRLLMKLLLHRGQYEAVVALPGAAAADSRAFAIADFLHHNDPANTRALCLHGHQALPQVAYVSMVKNEADIIYPNLCWHHRLGIRRFFLIDNLSTDSTRAEIARFEANHPDAQVLVLHDPVVAHYQGRKVTGACRFVLALWPDVQWFVLVDGDEFVCAERPLHQMLAEVPAEVDALILTKSVYALTVGDDGDEAHGPFFERITKRRPLMHASNKVLARAKPLLRIGQGNHRVVDESLDDAAMRYQALPGLSCREFPVRSWQHYRRKIIQGGLAVAAAMQQGASDGEIGGFHWSEAYQVYLDEGDAGLRRLFEATVEKNTALATLVDPLQVNGGANPRG